MQSGHTALDIINFHHQITFLTLFKKKGFPKFPNRENFHSQKVYGNFCRKFSTCICSHQDILVESSVCISTSAASEPFIWNLNDDCFNQKIISFKTVDFWHFFAICILCFVFVFLSFVLFWKWWAWSGFFLTAALLSSSSSSNEDSNADTGENVFGRITRNYTAQTRKYTNTLVVKNVKICAHWP